MKRRLVFPLPPEHYSPLASGSNDRNLDVVGGKLRHLVQDLPLVGAGVKFDMEFTWKTCGWVCNSSSQTRNIEEYGKWCVVRTGGYRARAGPT